ncbi:MAG TPA: hypothetical protein VII16_09940 [Actinomycetes bacterium]
MPTFGDVFTDVRGGDRTMRVSSHGERGVVVVSLWFGAVCRGSFRMAAGDVSKLISTLGEIGLSVDSASTPGRRSRDSTWEATGLGSRATAGAGAPDRSESAAEQTGDVTGAAESRRLSSVPVLGVA